MSLAESTQRAKSKQQDATIQALKKQVTLLQQALNDARTARDPKPVAKVKPRYTHGDIVRVFFADSHGSSCDGPAFAAFIADLRRINPHEVIMGGDIVNCGGFLAQHHVLGYVAETSYSYAEDTLHANAHIDQVQQAAAQAHIEYIEGNHEERVERWCVTQTLRHGRDAEMLRQAFAPEFVLGLKKRGIPYYRRSVCYDDLTLHGAIRRGKCFFTHGVSIAKNASEMHLRKIGGNIVYGDTHRAQSETVRITNLGVIAAHNPGCLCKLQPLWKHGDPTTWTHGYAIQFVDKKSGNFFHLNVPIVDGVSMFRTSLTQSHEPKK